LLTMLVRRLSKPLPRETLTRDAQSIVKRPIEPVPKNASDAWATVFIARSDAYCQKSKLNIFIRPFCISVLAVLPRCTDRVGSRNN
jgi:hypothetical protein